MTHVLGINQRFGRRVAEGVLLHGGEDLLCNTLGDVRAKPVFPSRFVLASPGEGNAFPHAASRSRNSSRCDHGNGVMS
jgi:hypothetical protein